MTRRPPAAATRGVSRRRRPCIHVGGRAVRRRAGFIGRTSPVALVSSRHGALRPQSAAPGWRSSGRHRAITARGWSSRRRQRAAACRATGVRGRPLATAGGRCNARRARMGQCGHASMGLALGRALGASATSALLCRVRCVDSEDAPRLGDDGSAVLRATPRRRARYPRPERQPRLDRAARGHPGESFEQRLGVPTDVGGGQCFGGGDAVRVHAQYVPLSGITRKDILIRNVDGGT